MKKYIAAALILFITVSANAMSFSDIRTISRTLARDPIPASGSPRISETLVSQLANIAHQQISMFTWCCEDSASISIVSGQREYSFTSDMVAIERVSLDGNVLPATSIAKMDIKDSAWSQSVSTATPTYYYSNPGLHVFGFDSYPDTTTDSTINVTYIKQPADLVLDADIPFDAQTRLYPFHYTICLLTAALMCYSDNRAAEGNVYYTMYIDNVKNMTSTIRLSPDYIPGFTGGK